MAASESVLVEAERIINGPRRAAYGPVRESFAKVAAGWSELFGVPVTPEQVALAMVWLKVCREANAHSRDNVVDVAGYAGLLGQMTEEGSQG